MVGGWSYRKGCDLIVEAVRQTEYTLLHVGSIVDVPFPDEEHFTHHSVVDQKQLVEYYNQAQVFILPSREEGLAMVQAQAIACNLPLIGSCDSGAEDLKQMAENSEYITIIRQYTTGAVANAINKVLSDYKKPDYENYIGNMKEKLTWQAYGKRYAQFINSIVKEKDV